MIYYVVYYKETGKVYEILLSKPVAMTDDLDFIQISELPEDGDMTFFTNLFVEDGKVVKKDISE